MTYECKCSDPRGHKYSNITTGRVMQLCDDCKGWRYERSPVTSRAQTSIRRHKRLSLVPLYNVA